MTERNAETLARGLLEDQQRRWVHVCGVAACALELKMEQAVVDAAWLHDIGYSPEAKDTGMHAIDGAFHLRDRDWPSQVVSLVAHHTGAWSEAHERGFTLELQQFPSPPEDLLDALTLCDLVVNPAGGRIEPRQRIVEILERYEPGHPVHRAVKRSRGELMDRATRAWFRLSADVRGISPFEGVA